MKPKLLALLVANLFLAVPFAASAQMQWTGSSVSLGVQNAHTDAKDPSKLREYRDLDGGSVLGGFEMRGRSDNYYLNGYGENLGRDDQYVDLKGGSYGRFKYRLYSDELRHNFGSGPGALSPFSGIGGSTLTATFPNINTATWNGFDHSYKRQDWGGMFELQPVDAWYFRAEANEVKRQGINVFSGAQGTSPGNGFIDLPSPIDYKTRNVSGEVGYATRRGHFAVNLLHSKFENSNDLLRWSNGYLGGLDTTILPPDNNLNRIAVNGNLRQLPGSSTLAGRLTHTKLTNEVQMLQNILSTGSTNPATNPSDSAFNGDVKKTTLSLSLASRPMRDLDTKLSYNYAKEKNDSTEVRFTPAVGSGLLSGTTNPLANCANVAGANVCAPELFHYKKSSLGAEAGYRLDRGNKLSGGLDHSKIDRERVDFVSTTDNKLFLEYKHTSPDGLTGRVKYQHLQRRSDFEANTAALAANPIDLYVRRFDFANVNQNQLKVAMDATPVPLLDVGYEVIYKKNDYKDTTLGRTGDVRQEYYASLAYGDANRFRVLLFGDVEFLNYDSSHRVGTGNPDPSAPPTVTTYNWQARNKDKAWQVGMGADWLPSAQLTLKVSYIYANTHGTTDFSIQPGGAPTAGTQPINNFDNTTRTSLNLKGIYNYDRHWEFSGGYSHERYRFSDIGYDNTQYFVQSATATQNAYVTGQFSFQPYRADIVYFVSKYKF